MAAGKPEQGRKAYMDNITIQLYEKLHNLAFDAVDKKHAASKATIKTKAALIHCINTAAAKVCDELTASIMNEYDDMDGEKTGGNE